MDFLTAYRAAVEMRKIADEVVSPDGAGLVAVSTIRKGLVDDRGSRAATTVMLVMAPAVLEATGIACDARCKRGSGPPESTCAGRMTAMAIVAAARAAPASPKARRGRLDGYELEPVAPALGGAKVRIL